jgi:hypothetical protein
MQKPQESWKILLIYSSLVAIVAILILGGMAFSPSEPASRVFLGLSLPRLALAAGLFTALLFCTFLAIKAFSDHRWAENASERWFGKSRLGTGITWFAGISFGLGWIGCFLPFYRAGSLAIHWERIRPVMVFLLLASAATLVVAFLKRSNLALQAWKRSNVYKSSLILFFPSIVLLGIMLYTDFGVYASEDYWYGAGVPLLVSQLIVALIGGILFLQAETRWDIKRFDLIVLLLLYTITAMLWAREPLDKSFLFIGPYAPNRALYPFADGALYDTASQFALIGKNLLFNNRPFFERALYASFLVYLHSIVGQDYGRLMAAQAALFAIFPALVYLIGKSLNFRAVGFAAAIVAMFRGANSIAASNMIDLANPKMMLTDFPTAIGIALITYLACEWLQKPQQKWHYTLWTGGVLGLSIMLRTNAVMLFLFVPFLAFLVFPFKWKTWIASSFLMLLAVFAFTLPWELRNQSLGGQMYGSVIRKIQNVIDLRYRKPLPPESSFLQENSLSSLSLQQTQVLLEIYNNAKPIQQPPCNSVVCFVPNHFLHNILTSILVLPTSPTLDDLRHTVKESQPYWQPDWNGSFPSASIVVFGLNIFFIILGISVAWNQQRLAGLIPLAIFVFYNLSNGLARTSGGRYIVPIDWILTIYFLIGVFQIIVFFANAVGMEWMLSRESSEQVTPGQSFRTNDVSRTLGTLAIIFGLGALVPLAEILHADRYQNFDISKTLSEHQAQIDKAGLSLPEIHSFLQNPKAEILVGRALYPRYYIENEGEVHFYPVIEMGFPRTTFTLIGNEGEKGIVLPGEKPDYFPHAVDTLVLGCKEKRYVDALAVILLDETRTVYTRSPASPLQCPLKQPVCDNNHNCY